LSIHTQSQEALVFRIEKEASRDVLPSLNRTLSHPIIEPSKRGRRHVGLYCVVHVAVRGKTTVWNERVREEKLYLAESANAYCPKRGSTSEFGERTPNIRVGERSGKILT
jgi:hypothetical protein